MISGKLLRESGCCKDENVSCKLKSDPRSFARYMDAIEHPNRCGFRFQNNELTIGKVYLYYVWGKTRKKALKSAFFVLPACESKVFALHCK